MIERYILREYKNMSETFQLKIFKDKDNTKYLEKELKLTLKEQANRKLQLESLIDDSW